MRVSKHTANGISIPTTKEGDVLIAISEAEALAIYRILVDSSPCTDFEAITLLNLTGKIRLALLGVL